MWPTSVPKKPLRWAALAALLAALLFLFSGTLGFRAKGARFDVQLVPLTEHSRLGAAAGIAPRVRASLPVLFSITIPAHLGNARLETRVLSEKGELVWVGVGLTRHESLGTGQLYLPARFLRPGEYRLAVGRAQPDADRVEFPFRVE